MLQTITVHDRSRKRRLLIYLHQLSRRPQANEIKSAGRADRRTMAVKEFSLSRRGLCETLANKQNLAHPPIVEDLGP